MELPPTLSLNLALLIVPSVFLVLVFRQWLLRHICWTVALTALCNVLLFWDGLFYYESFALFAMLVLVQLAATSEQRSVFTTIEKNKSLCYTCSRGGIYGKNLCIIGNRP